MYLLTISVTIFDRISFRIIDASSKLQFGNFVVFFNPSQWKSASQKCSINNEWGYLKLIWNNVSNHSVWCDYEDFTRFVIFVSVHQQQVSVTIYYEALCPDSKSFFTEHFKPTWDLLKKYIKLELVPFGKSKSTDYRIDQTQTSPSNVKFTCRHTDNECLGHRYQACILNETRAYDWNDKVNFINCLMSKSSITTLYGKTIESVSVLKNCQ